jgi:cation transport ATPase
MIIGLIIIDANQKRICTTCCCPSQGKHSKFQVPSEDYNEFQLLQLAYSAEIKSEHPIAKAIVNKAIEQSIPTLDVSEFNSISGYGVVASNLEKRVFVDSPAKAITADRGISNFLGFSIASCSKLWLLI